MVDNDTRQRVPYVQTASVIAFTAVTTENPELPEDLFLLWAIS